MSIPYEKLDINNIEKIEKFIKDEEIDFVQFASHPNRIYLCKVIGRRAARKAKIKFSDFGSTYKLLESLVQKNKIKENESK
jgi:phage-related protein